jgi:hypothetical protein
VTALLNAAPPQYKMTEADLIEDSKMRTLNPLHNRMTLAWLTCALWLGGCGEGTINVEDQGIKEQGAAARQSELMYLKDASEVLAAFETGVASFVPAQAFYGVNVIATLDGSVEGIEYQLRDVNGQWTEWAPLVEMYSEDKFHNTSIDARMGATELRLRGGDAMEFTRLEFAGELTEDEDHFHFNDDIQNAEGAIDEALDDSQKIQMAISRPGAWALPSATRTRGNSQYVAYTSAPSYNGGRNCSGTFTAGARDLGNYLVNRFPGAKYFQGYNCRQIRGGTGMSVHGTGRAIDVFIPLHRGAADNDLGDPVANWLVENASNIGIQMIIWDRTVWSGNRSGDKARYYSGEHPHHDHLHIELTPQAASKQTAWFRTRADAPSSGGSSGGSTSQASCASQSLGRDIPHGQFVQMAYNKCGGTCKWSKCSNGAWVCGTPGSGDVKHGNASCGGAAAPAQPAAPVTCRSNTLGRDVPAGEWVQMSYNSCGGTCKWAECSSNGGWSCGTPGSSDTKHASASCNAAPSGRSCYSRTMGRNISDGQSVQMSYNSCGGTCEWAVCDDGAWDCVGGPQGVSHPHSSCR